MLIWICADEKLLQLSFYLFNIQNFLIQAEFSKDYSSEIEEQLRKKVFLDNVETIQKHNQLYEAGEKSYEMGINEFSDKVRMIIFI